MLVKRLQLSTSTSAVTTATPTDSEPKTLVPAASVGAIPSAHPTEGSSSSEATSAGSSSEASPAATANADQTEKSSTPNGDKTPDSDASRRSAELSHSDSSSSLSSGEEKSASGSETQLTLADLTSPPASPRALQVDETDANFTYRTNIVRELHKTEQFYVKGLTNMLKVFVLPLRELALRGGAQEQLISVDDLKVIFSNVDVLVNVNKKFLEDLTVALESWSPTTKIAPVFLKVVPFLKVYSQYINNFNAALAKYEQCMKVKRFKKFVDDVMSTLAIMDLDSLPSYLSTFATLSVSFFFLPTNGCGFVLVMPIQRIPRYQLLIQELLKKTAPDHPDYDDLQQALGKILQLAEEMNSSKRDSEQIGKVADVQRQLIFPEYSKRKRAIVTALRRYVRETRVHEVFENNDRSPYNYLFMFNDCLLMTKAKKKGFLFHLFFYLKRINCVEAEDPEGDPAKAAIKISSEQKQISLIVVFATTEERDTWMKDIQTGQQLADQQRTLTSDDEDDAQYRIEREKAKQEKRDRSSLAKKDKEKDKDGAIAGVRRRFKTLDFKRRKEVQAELESMEEPMKTDRSTKGSAEIEVPKPRALTDELKDLVAKKAAK